MLDYAGAQGNALNTSGWIEDRNLGFSTMLSFHDSADTPTKNLLLATFTTDVNNKWLLTGVIPGDTTFSVTIPASLLASGGSPITRSVALAVVPGATVTIRRPVQLNVQVNSNQALPFRGNLAADAGAPGTFQWSSSDPNRLVIDNPTIQAPTFRVLSFPARVKIKVALTTISGQVARDEVEVLYWLSVKMRQESKRGEIPPCGRGFFKA